MINKKTILSKTTVIILLVFLISVSFNTVGGGYLTDGRSVEKIDISNDQKFDFNIKLLMLKVHMPSLSACIVKNDTIVWYKGYGYSSFYGLKKPTIDTIYSVYSSTKPVTATAILQLYEQGKFELDDDINNYLSFSVRNPNYPNIPITFRMLLAHQSSLGHNSIAQTLHMMQAFKLSRYTIGYPYPMIKEILQPRGLFYIALSWENFEPGSEVAYSNLNYILLEHLIEVLSNQTYQEYCIENIFEPLEMNNSSFTYENLNKENCAYSYENIGNFYYRLNFRDFPFGAGGLKTTINDFSHFLIAHMNSGVYKNVEILNKSTISEMHKLQYEYSYYQEIVRFGLGWTHWDIDVYGLSLEGHEGRYLGGTSSMMMNKTNNAGFIIFTNKMLHRSNIVEYKAYVDLIYALSEKTKEFI